VHQDDDLFDRERSMRDCRNGLCKPEYWTTLNTNDRVAKKESKRKNAQALFHIQIALDKSLFPRIAGAKTATDAWRTLQEAYQCSDQVKVVKLQTLKREFEDARSRKCKGLLCESKRCSQ
jgi:hypothetical protein